MPSTTPVLKKMSPQLQVASIENSIDFYTKKLGFRLEFRFEDFYAGLVKDGHSIHIKSGSTQRNEDKNMEDLEITFSVDCIERLYTEVLGNSIVIIQPLRDMPYGREFYIADPDLNIIAFMEEP